MLVAAALVPDTVLLLPGAAGRGPDAPELVALRRAAAAAVLSAVGPAQRVLVVAPGAVDRSVVGSVHAGAAAAGVPDHLLTSAVPRVALERGPGTPQPVAGSPGTGAVVGIRLALDAGAPDARLHVLEVARGPRSLLRAIGAAAVASVPTALVVVGSGAARHGDGAPLPHDDAAATVDGALRTALDAGGPAARDALAALDAGQAAALGTTGWAPWQVLVGALDTVAAPLPAPAVLHAGAWRGAAHAAVAWRVAP